MWLVSFNPQKTKTLYVTNKSSSIASPLMFLNKRIEEVSSHKHLGVTLTCNLSWSSHVEDVWVKAMRRVNIMKGLKYKLSRLALERMYICYIRPVLEYSDAVWGNCGEVNSNKLETVQIEAARVVTGAMKGTNSTKLLNELCWEPLQRRREIHRLVLFYKIIHGESPNYLQTFLPPSNISTRRGNTYSSIHTRTDTFSRSFYPDTVREWNKLDKDIREAPNVSTFKVMLNSDKKTSNKLFYYGDRKAYKITLKLFSLEKTSS